MFVLMGMLDSDEYHPPYTDALACSTSRERLEQYWESTRENSGYLEFRIEEVPLLGPALDTSC